MSTDTIILVTGCCVVTELLDRPIAEFLRNEIDKRGSHRYQRGIIVGDLWWFRDESLHKHPVIAIGGPAINTLTSELVEENLTWLENVDHCGRDLSHPPKLSIWGETTSDTQERVTQFVNDARGLSTFLELCWTKEVV
jgi:hypothetical protein